MFILIVLRLGRNKDLEVLSLRIILFTEIVVLVGVWSNGFFIAGIGNTDGEGLPIRWGVSLQDELRSKVPHCDAVALGVVEDLGHVRFHEHDTSSEWFGEVFNQGWIG